MSISVLCSGGHSSATLAAVTSSANMFNLESRIGRGELLVDARVE
jgi:hypothetical protein